MNKAVTSLYYPQDHYDQQHRGYVFPLLKPFLKWDNFSDAKRKELYAVSEKEYSFKKNIAEADYTILPMAWNYYVNHDQKSKALQFLETCKAQDKKVLVLNAGDFGYTIPWKHNLLVFRLGGYKSKFRNSEFSLPVFIEDPLKKYYKTNVPTNREYSTIPTVGFCGQTNNAQINRAMEIAKIVLRNAKHYFGLNPNEPQKLVSSSYIRGTVLNRLQKASSVETNFIFRKKYRAGVRKNRDAHRSTYEFYDNLRDSDYILCVRGAGNFSVRFYEALAMGRIPVFLNTDCALPLDHKIDWKKHVVWVEYADRKQIDQKILDFHNNLNPASFLDLQCKNRVLWKEKLTLGGFFKTFFNE